MAMNEGFDGDPGSGLGLGFSHLLESVNGGEEMGFDLGGGGGDDQSFMYSSSFPCLKPSTMLCFGSNVCSSNNNNNKQKSASDHSSSVSSSNNSSCTNSNLITNNNKSKRRSHGGGGEVMKTEDDDERRNGSGQDFDTVMGKSSNNKKPKKEKPGGGISNRPTVRKEKLGERITALQQLVSPFGKTDTASVLHEAMGYIRFLHDQVQVLSSPYLQNMTSSSVQEGGRGDDDEKMMMKMKRSSSYGGSSGVDDLRSRGLCLVPVDYTVHVADSNGADLWSPAVVMGRNTGTSTMPSNNNSISTTTTTTAAFNQY